MPFGGIAYMLAENLPEVTDLIIHVGLALSFGLCDVPDKWGGHLNGPTTAILFYAIELDKVP